MSVILQFKVKLRKDMDNILKYQITTNLSIQQICIGQVLGIFPDTGNLSAKETDNTLMEPSF